LVYKYTIWQSWSYPKSNMCSKRSCQKEFHFALKSSSVHKGLAKETYFCTKKNTPDDPPPWQPAAVVG
jgi:hypothetical protein